MNNPKYWEKTEVIREKLKQNGVTQVSFSNGLPHNVRTMQGREWLIGDEKLTVEFHTLYADGEFNNIFSFQLLEGRNVEYKTPGVQEFVINETAAKTYGWENPAGMEFKQGEDTIRIVGLLKDFHLQSKAQPIRPLRIGHIKNSWINTMSVSFSGGDPKEIVKTIESTLKEFLLIILFLIHFLTKRMQNPTKLTESREKQLSFL